MQGTWRVEQNVTRYSKQYVRFPPLVSDIKNISFNKPIPKDEKIYTTLVKTFVICKISTVGDSYYSLSV